MAPPMDDAVPDEATYEDFAAAVGETGADGQNRVAYPPYKLETTAPIPAAATGPTL